MICGARRCLGRSGTRTTDTANFVPADEFTPGLFYVQICVGWKVVVGRGDSASPTCSFPPSKKEIHPVGLRPASLFQGNYPPEKIRNRTAAEQSPRLLLRATEGWTVEPFPEDWICPLCLESAHGLTYTHAHTHTGAEDEPCGSKQK